ncbi:hypothetical protein DFH06DRAFT_1139351 [Mycena polygramma]|nr:hypothetical protein DFH06DRAFT_1139351 [Mycena polygramma]
MTRTNGKGQVRRAKDAEKRIESEPSAHDSGDKDVSRQTGHAREEGQGRRADRGIAASGRGAPSMGGMRNATREAKTKEVRKEEDLRVVRGCKGTQTQCTDVLGVERTRTPVNVDIVWDANTSVNRWSPTQEGGTSPGRKGRENGPKRPRSEEMEGGLHDAKDAPLHEPRGGNGRAGICPDTLKILPVGDFIGSRGPAGLVPAVRKMARAQREEGQLRGAQSIGPEGLTAARLTEGAPHDRQCEEKRLNDGELAACKHEDNGKEKKAQCARKDVAKRRRLNDRAKAVQGRGRLNGALRELEDSTKMRMAQ